MGRWNFEPLEQAFASAAINPELWPTAMDIAAKTTNGAGALLLPISGAQMPDIPTSSCLQEVNDVYFRDRWYERDERYKGVPLLMRNGIIGDLDLFNPGYIKSHPYYQEFLAPHGLQWFAGVRVAFGQDVWCLSIQRKTSQGPFSDSEKHRLVRLSKTLPSSIALAKAVGFAAGVSVLDVLEASGSAALLINRQGEVFQMNESGERLLASDPRVVNRRLVSKDPNATHLFERALNDLLWRRSGPALSVPVVLPRRGKRPLLAYPIRVPTLSSNALADCKAIVILLDLNSPKLIPEETLRNAFHLTEAESRVAARLAKGRGIDDIADELRLSNETVRSQLKAVFAKTNTHRQAELVALVHNLLGRSDWPINGTPPSSQR
ncbi:MAG TPA: helix-turn-helix transcriptional regulator [Gemmataceae bacterium]|nr:helix-turn-helix transcriptional regulator [Gemmataceae bacterium]